MEITLGGIAVSPGIAIGPALVFDVNIGEIPQYEISDPHLELARLARAIEAAREDLSNVYTRTAKALGESHAEIFNAHLMLLDDPVIRQELEERTIAEKVNVEYLLDDIRKQYAKILSSVPDAQLQERTTDLSDVVERVLRHLLYTERPNLRHLKDSHIVVAHELTPSDTVNMDRKHTLGIALDSGSTTSHTAILARAMELPAVMGLRNLSAHIEPGVQIIVDGHEGLVILRPDDETLARYTQLQSQLIKARKKLMAKAVKGACISLDGTPVPTYANIELPMELDLARACNAEGIGLYRTEYLFLDRNTLPTEEEQYQSYAQVVDAMAPKPVILRTIDIGGDKLAAHLQIEHEDNPQLGWRAIRFSLERPDIFMAQLRAILRASAHGNVKIMFPMISSVEELRCAMVVLNEVRADLEKRGIPFDKDIEVGSMIEVPSAVTVADLLAKECDFFSIGTNDLIQYSLAVDRVNEKIAHLYEPTHPAVLRMIYQVAEAAKKYNVPCSLCGEMAGDPLYTELLLGLGVQSLSMSCVALPLIRAQIAGIDLDAAKTMVQELLDLPTAAEIKEKLQQRHKEREF